MVLWTKRLRQLIRGSRHLQSLRAAEAEEHCAGIKTSLLIGIIVEEVVKSCKIYKDGVESPEARQAFNVSQGYRERKKGEKRHQHHIRAPFIYSKVVEREQGVKETVEVMEEVMITLTQFVWVGCHVKIDGLQYHWPGIVPFLHMIANEDAEGGGGFQAIKGTCRDQRTLQRYGLLRVYIEGKQPHSRALEEALCDPALSKAGKAVLNQLDDLVVEIRDSTTDDEKEAAEDKLGKYLSEHKSTGAHDKNMIRLLLGTTDDITTTAGPYTPASSRIIMVFPLDSEPL